MKRLFLMRHAQAASGASVDDHDRPLEEQGVATARKVGRLLYLEGDTPDHILCSSAQRTIETATAVAEGCRYQGETKSSRKLYNGDVRTYIEWIRTTDDAVHQLLVIGHNPTIGDLIDALTGKAVDMVPATVARLFVPVDRWSELDDDVIARLSKFWNPSDLPAEV